MSCGSLLGDDEMKALIRLEAWVGKYNSLVFEKPNIARQALISTVFNEVSVDGNYDMGAD